MNKTCHGITVAAGTLILTSFPGLAFTDEAPEKTQIAYHELDTTTVTATRIERGSREVPAAISVIDQEIIDNATMFNVLDAIRGIPGVLIDSKNGGYDVRLIIRGAGQKANYGVREISVLRDGVPMTDPDSFSRFDFIDTQDIERIEVIRGPGSLYGAGSTGGVVHFISKPVFDTSSNRIKVGAGSYDSLMLNAKYGGMVSKNNALSITASHRETSNDWRKWNEFETDQVSLKHGLKLGEGSSWESELSYTKADLQLPASMNETEFEEFEDSGEQGDTTSPWQNNGRYSDIWFFNSRLKQEYGNFTFKPRIYGNHWEHYHPVTGSINDTPGTDVVGADLEFSHEHQLAGPSTLVAGITGRVDDSQDAKKYKYADVTYNPYSGRIASTESDRSGELMQTQDATNTLYGIYMQETLRPSDAMNIDIGFRFDKSNFDINTVQYSEYNWGTGDYVDFRQPVVTDTDKTFDLFAPRLGLTYAMNDQLSIYGLMAQGMQVPSESEIRENPDLDAATARNIEAGLKGRTLDWSFDLTVYRTEVEDEIVSTLNGYVTEFQNAGETSKKGLEFEGRYYLGKNFWAGGSYAYSDYTFTDFQEPIRGVGNVDRSGNSIPYIPKNQYSLSLDFNNPNGFRGRLQTDTWGSYYMDNANTEKYDGYDFLTSLTLGYGKGRHGVTLNFDNLFDQRYAAEVKKNTSGLKTYYAGSPRRTMLTYTYSL